METISTGLWMPRPYIASDRGDLAKSVAPKLDQLYPGGGRWLERRLDQIEKGQGNALVVAPAGLLAGVAIETPKETGRVKLSTLWVRSGLRRRGIGRSLLAACRRGWEQREVERVDVTCATEVCPQLAPLLHASGFSLQSIDRDRYGEGRHEVVFSWFPDTGLNGSGRPQVDLSNPALSN